MDTALNRPPQRKVLVIEDNELNRKLLEVRLEIHGYEVVTTSEGAAALDIAREQQPDLILMNTQLPDISGIDAIRRLKADDHRGYRFCDVLRKGEYSCKWLRSLHCKTILR